MTAPHRTPLQLRLLAPLLPDDWRDDIIRDRTRCTDAGAGLALRSFDLLTDQDPGFRTEDVVVASIQVGEERCRDARRLPDSRLAGGSRRGRSDLAGRVRPRSRFSAAGPCAHGRVSPVLCVLADH